MTGGLQAKGYLLAKHGWTLVEVVCEGLNGGRRRCRRRWRSPDGALMLPAPEAFKLIPQPLPKGRGYRRLRARRRISPAVLMNAILGVFYRKQRS